MVFAEYGGRSFPDWGFSCSEYAFSTATWKCSSLMGEVVGLVNEARMNIGTGCIDWLGWRIHSRTILTLPLSCTVRVLFCGSWELCSGGADTKSHSSSAAVVEVLVFVELLVVLARPLGGRLFGIG